MVNGEIPSSWLDLVKQNEELMDEASNDLTELWANNESDLFHDDDENKPELPPSEFEYFISMNNNLPNPTLLG